MPRSSTARSSACQIRKRCWWTSSARSTPSGVVMVIAPTVDSRTARLFRSAWWEFNAGNLHYFSADTLQSLLIKTGYGDPIIDGDDSAVSLEYFRSKIPGGVVRVVSGDAEAARVGDAGRFCATAPFIR